MPKPANNQENSDLCVCPKCPLFTPCNQEKAEKLFCARQTSACDMDIKKMCICGICQVFSANNLKGGYFCKKEIVE